MLDVTPNMEAYGPGKGYNNLTACDATIALDRQELDVTEAMQTRAAWLVQSAKTGGEGANSWIGYFLRKYEPVGWLTEGCCPRVGMPGLEAPYEGNELPIVGDQDQGQDQDQDQDQDPDEGTQEEESGGGAAVGVPRQRQR